MQYTRKDGLLNVSNWIIFMFTVITSLLAFIAVALPLDGFDLQDFMLLYITIIQLSVYLVNRIGYELLRRYLEIKREEKMLENSWWIGVYLALGISLVNATISGYLAGTVLL